MTIQSGLGAVGRLVKRNPVLFGGLAVGGAVAASQYNNLRDGSSRMKGQAVAGTALTLAGSVGALLAAKSGSASLRKVSNVVEAAGAAAFISGGVGFMAHTRHRDSETKEYYKDAHRGFVNLDVLSRLVRTDAGRKELQEMRVADTKYGNSNGYADMNEMDASFVGRGIKEPGKSYEPVSINKAVQSAMDLYDSDRNGAIKGAEFKFIPGGWNMTNALYRHDVAQDRNLSKSEVKEIMQSLDTDKSGDLSTTEWRYDL